MQVSKLHSLVYAAWLFLVTKIFSVLLTENEQPETECSETACGGEEVSPTIQVSVLAFPEHMASHGHQNNSLQVTSTLTAYLARTQP